jgi:hypothetical protein
VGVNRTLRLVTDSDVPLPAVPPHGRDEDGSLE